MGSTQPPRHADGPAAIDCGTLTQALDQAASGAEGIQFHTGRGQVVETLGYARLRDEARDWAQHLLGCGLQPGQRVCLVAETDGDFVRAFFACQYAGLVPVPVPLPTVLGGRKQYLEHLQRMAESVGADAVMTPASLDGWIQEAFAGRGLAFVGTAASLLERPAAAVELPRPEPDRLAYLQFSSGSTRFPRAIAVTHRAVMANYPQHRPGRTARRSR
jgi:Acyl-CoA synthetases (AMP-forming)/AMP-acid ligases II